VDYLLDTSVAIPLRDGDPAVTSKVGALNGVLFLSIVSRIELESGVYREPAYVSVRRRRVDAMLPTFQVLPFGEEAVEAYRLIVETLGYSRRTLLDRMIAAQALVHRATLVTRNSDDFRDVPRLSLLEW
jgi:predicted nucleic acid-binding protein